MRRLVLPGALLCAALALSGCSPVPQVPEPAAQGETTDLPSRLPIPSYTPPPPTTFTVVASGDVLLHPELTAQATTDGTGKRDFRPLLSGVKQVVSSADLAICHLETPLAGPDGPFTGWPTFSVPPEIAVALADTGYDECSTASNHTLDRGAAGVGATLDTLDAAGVGHAGSARSAAEAATPRILDVHGVKVGHVAFTFGFNGFRLPAGQPWLANQLDAADVLAAARAAKGAGADVVIVSLHWGTEFRAEPTAEQRSLAATLLADDSIDLIVGHHAHVVQPMEQVGGKWVAYGLGNHLARHAEPQGTTEEGMIARFRFAKGLDGRWRVDRAEYVPTLIDLGPPIRLIDLTAVGNSERRTAALQRIDQVVSSRGAPVTRSGG